MKFLHSLRENEAIYDPKPSRTMHPTPSPTHPLQLHCAIHCLLSTFFTLFRVRQHRSFYRDGSLSSGSSCTGPPMPCLANWSQAMPMDSGHLENMCASPLSRAAQTVTSWGQSEGDGWMACGGVSAHHQQKWRRAPLMASIDRLSLLQDEPTCAFKHWWAITDRRDVFSFAQPEMRT